MFKAAFGSPADAAALVRDLLPTAVRDAIAWDSLEREPGSFVDAELSHRHSDLLFSTRLRTGEPSLAYILLEHQSTSDPAMALRILAYKVRIWEQFRADHARAPLPPVIAVLVSHAPGGWTTAPSFEAMFDPHALALPGLPERIPRFSFLVDDLVHLSNEDLKARPLAMFQKLALWLLRDARDPKRLLDKLRVLDVRARHRPTKPRRDRHLCDAARVHVSCRRLDEPRRSSCQASRVRVAQ